MVTKLFDERLDRINGCDHGDVTDFATFSREENGCEEGERIWRPAKSIGGKTHVKGVGILVVPDGLASRGWLSMLLIIVIAIVASYSDLWIQRCMDRDPDIGSHAFGNKGRIQRLACLIAGPFVFSIVTPLAATFAFWYLIGTHF